MKVTLKHTLTQNDIDDFKKGHFQITDFGSLVNSQINLIRVLTDNSNRFIYAFLKNNNLILDDLYALFFEKLTIGSVLFLTIEKCKCEGGSDDIKILISENSHFTTHVNMPPLISHSVISELKSIQLL